MRRGKVQKQCLSLFLFENTHNRRHFEWLQVLKEVRIGNLAWCPLALVIGILDHRCSPLALVLGIGHEWCLPLAAASNLFAHGIIDQRCLPFTIDFSVPVLWLDRSRIGYHIGFIVQPILRLDSTHIGYLRWCIIVPVIGFLCRWIWNLLALIPIRWLLVSGVIDFCWWIDSWLEIGQQRSLVNDLMIQSYLEAVVRANHQLIQMRQLVLEGLFQSVPKNRMKHATNESAKK